MNLKIFAILLLIGILNCYGQKNMNESSQLKHTLVQKFLCDDSLKGTENEGGFIIGRYQNNIIGVCYSEIELYNKKHYKFEFMCQGNGYYDIGEISYDKGVIMLSSLISKFSDNSDSLYHYKIVDMTGVTFALDTMPINKIDGGKFYRLTSFGKKANELNISNNGRKQWVNQVKINEITE